MHRVYMDANATTPLLPEVMAAMRPWFDEQFGNASSIHFHGQRARAAVDHARETVATMLDCRPAEIVFTSGGTEGDNLALFGMLQPGDHLITSSIEHHAVLHAAEHLRDRGIEVTFLPVSSSGLVDPEDVRRALRPQTKLISVMTANNETGVLQPVAEIGQIAQEADVYFHTDAVQAAAKLPLDVKSIGCDLLTISGHKMHAPQGTGVLYVRRGTQIEPLFFGGLHERHRRAGTENVAGIVGLGKAAELAMAGLEAGVPLKMAALRDRLETQILGSIDEAGINGGESPRVANTTNLWFDHVEAEALVIALDLKGLAVSGGSACQSGATEPSHVLLAMGLSEERARASVRFSLMKTTTEEDVDFAASLVPQAVARLRELSPVYAKKSAATKTAFAMNSYEERRLP
ncbi:MAG TPA: cysteine desulfurase family protein [Acidisarcina sp.]|nr:cysteine desulfurase family protein [Acidisarcina sp.]